MVKYVKGDLLNSNCTYICHQVNCRGVMGSGIAKQIRERWPVVYESYRDVIENNRVLGGDLLGEVDFVLVGESNYRYVVNMFCQYNFGPDGKRYTSYDAFVTALETIAERVPLGGTIGFPKNIGCGLGGGNWKVISALIEEILGQTHRVYIYELENSTPAPPED